MRGARNVYRVGSTEVKVPLRSPKRKREDNIKINLRKNGYAGVDHLYMSQYTDQLRALVTTIIEILSPRKARNFFDT
jgi:hypothetical protein